jgi:hypothetical protein
MIIDGIGRKRYEVGDQYAEVLKDGKLHMLKVERSGASCLGCCYMTDCPDEHNGSHCSLEKHRPCKEKCVTDPDFIIKDLGILNDDGLLPCYWDSSIYPVIHKESDEAWYEIDVVEPYDDICSSRIQYASAPTLLEAKDIWNRRS